MVLFVCGRFQKKENNHSAVSTQNACGQFQFLADVKKG